jgi:hypothetical protein
MWIPYNGPSSAGKEGRTARMRGDRARRSTTAVVVAALAAFAILPFGPREARAQCGAPDQPPCKPGEPAQAPPRKLANRLDEIGPLLSNCLRLPPADLARPGMRVTLRIAFTRNGEVLGEPRFTYLTPGVPPEIKAAYERALADMLDRCTPLPITKELGAAIAGRPFVIPLLDTRTDKKA